MRKILASDYDGTLNQNGISARDVEAIKKWQAAGNLFGIVTGRDFNWSYGMFKRENKFPFDFVISHNGAVGSDQNGNILFSNQMKGAGLARLLIEEGLRLSVLPCGVAFEKTRLDFLPENYIGKHRDSRPYFDVDVLDDVVAFNLADIHFETVEEATVAAKILREKYGAFANPGQNGNNIDISPAGVDKCTSIAQYAELMGVAKDDIWTAGDNLNDLPMIVGYHGCAMKNGVQEVQDAAEYVCENVAEVIELAMKK